MINYSYQTLRYQPDKISGEFLNVGLVLLDERGSFLKAKTIGKIGRVKNLFPKVKSRYFISKLNNVSKEINCYSNNFPDKLLLESDIKLEKLTNSVIPVDDSSLYFSEVEKGIDINPEIAFNHLFQRLVLSNDELEEKHLSDKDVWTEYYKSYFEDHKQKFKSKSILTNGDELNFDFAVKNGIWNYLEPVTFDLSRVSNIKEKVYKWMGKLEELDSSEEEFKLFILSKMPEDENLKEFIKDRIGVNDADNFKVEIIEPSEAESFSRNLIESIF